MFDHKDGIDYYHLSIVSDKISQANIRNCLLPKAISIFRKKCCLLVQRHTYLLLRNYFVYSFSTQFGASSFSDNFIHVWISFLKISEIIEDHKIVSVCKKQILKNM